VYLTNDDPGQTTKTREKQAPDSQIPQPGFFDRPQGRRVSAILLAVVLAGASGFLSLNWRFGRRIDARLAVGPFSDTVTIFGAPQAISVGDALTRDELVERLQRNGYSGSRGHGPGSALGWYNLRAGAVEIFPGRDAPAGAEAGVIEFAEGKIARIVSLEDNTARERYQLQPAMLANISRGREQRRPVHFSDIPSNLVDAVISAEDKHFFQHTGFDALRILKAAYIDLKNGRKEQGASTLTMQLARGLWLNPDKSWKRKIQELLITMNLEHRLTKQQIFEDYANQVYLGRRGPFNVNGFGEAARDFFGKDLRQLTDAEAALLAGMVQRPSHYNPFRYPERARGRRNLVLALMRDNGYLDDERYRAAAAATVAVSQEPPDNLQYLIDVANNELESKLGEENTQARYVYTTLDPDLQQAAESAVRMGMRRVDELLHTQKHAGAIPAGQPQVALVALDPHTGEIKALVGGRDYGASQLNHVLAMRQPGSVFKPFVYAAALDTAVQGDQRIFTAASLLDDSPTTFYFGGRPYQPSNFRHEFMGEVTLRTALAHSLNVATVSLAQQIGYTNVAALARRAGLNNDIRPTPALALGAYECTPLEIARAYTTFANQGMRVTPTAIALVRGRNGEVVYQRAPQTAAALDPRVTYLMVNLMQEVLRSGTGAGVRSRGFTLPAAGKTGTSRDGWFAGFTTELLTVVWVGFDDNRDLDLEGARSALPIWAEFMKSAAKFRPYRDARPFATPPGVISVEMCAESGQLAGMWCPNTHSEMFIQGTEPAVHCELHSAAPSQSADRTLDLTPLPPASPAPAVRPAAAPPATAVPASIPPPNSPQAITQR
jgi:penicillin-binding protein 1B